MRQVPHYLIIGDGRMAHHTKTYLEYLSLPYFAWSRKKNSLSVLHKLQAETTHVLLLISDDAVDTFIEKNIDSKFRNLLVHFSGSLVSNYAHSAHPLQTFGSKLYAPENYLEIPFIIEKEGPAFSELLPGFPNTAYPISRSEKNFYHAHCVMANNFTTLLWKNYFETMQEKFQIDSKHLLPMLRQTFKNIEENPAGALTGPIARKDRETILENLNALKADKQKIIYEAFIQNYFPEVFNEKRS